MPKTKPTPREMLASNLKRLRSTTSQSDLAEHSGQRRALISGIESGKANPTLDTLSEIAKALKVSVSELLKHD